MTLDTTQRDQHGRFTTGHGIGVDSRFQAGKSSPNPRGRPWGVNKWVRVLRSRRYHRLELETVVTDDQAPPSQREAAVRLLLPYVEQSPPEAVKEARMKLFASVMSSLPTAELCSIVVDPRVYLNRRAAAYAILVERGILRPAPSRITP